MIVILLCIALGISVVSNIMLAIALFSLKSKYDFASKQLRYYNVCDSGFHSD